MKTNTINKRSTACLLALGLLVGGALTERTQAAAIITSNVSFDIGTSLYLYSYSVQNTGPLDLILVTVPANPSSNVLGIMAPVGFDLTFDPSQGWLNLNEDSNIFTDQTFASGSTVAPFDFRSALAPGTVTYSAFDVGGNEFTGSVMAPVPEPSASLLGGLVGMATCLKRRRRI
jgi:hypothetical protein